MPNITTNHAITNNNSHKLLLLSMFNIVGSKLMLVTLRTSEGLPASGFNNRAKRGVLGGGGGGGAFHATQNSGNFGWYIKWNKPLRFGSTGIFGTSFEGGPL